MSKYDISIVTFIDILGFGQVVEAANKPDEVASILNVLKRASEMDKEYAKLYDKKFVNFSDIAIRTTNILSRANRQKRIGILFHELIDLVYVQADLIQENILVRGSVTIGQIFVRKNLIFGPALNRAYQLERRLAVYPRIIIDPVVFQLLEASPALKAEHHDLETEKRYLRDLLTNQGDGIWFVDYLRAFESEVDEPEDYFSFLDSHRDLIREKSRLLEDLDDVSAKYNWLAHYHNNVVDKLDDNYLEQCGFSKDNLRVKDEDLGPMYNL